MEFGANVTPNAVCGADVNAVLKNTITNDSKTAGVVGGAFASGNTCRGPVTTGVFAGANA